MTLPASPSGSGTTGVAPTGRLGRVEFTVLLSMTMALVALGIDLMLPAFGAIRTELGLAPDSTAVAGIVTAYFLGLAVAQPLYGVLADRFGRKPVLYAGFAIYVAGALASALAPGLVALYLSRFVWGVGAAGGRVMTVSVVRDTFEGELMARAMSFIMAVFIIVPVLAPALGALVVSVAPWRWLFGLPAIFAAAVWLWSRRLPETLHPEYRRPLRWRPVLDAARFVVTNRLTLGYTLALTALYGAFASYLASSEIIVFQVFDLGGQFPLVFGGLAAVMGVAMLTNAALVGRVGLRRLVHLVLLGYVAVAGVFLWYVMSTGRRPPFWPFAAGLAVMLCGNGLLFPNMNSVAMGPMGAVAGTASAILGTISTALGALLGSFIDRSFDGTVTPLALGFAGCAAAALVLVLWAERGRLLSRTQAAESRAASTRSTK